MHESQMHKISSFISLTYNNQNIPKYNSLIPKDLTLFIKKLRKKLYPKKIRYFACGEYGIKTKRPHYHSIIFGYWPEDVKYYKQTNQKDNLYTSDSLTKIWGKGHVVIGSVTFESASYTASYVTKKITGEKSFSHYGLREPEYGVMSRRPGLGKTWYEKYKKETWATDSIVIRGKEMGVPKYYQEQLKAAEPETFRKLKEKRKDKNNSRYQFNMFKNQIKHDELLTKREKYTKLTTKFWNKEKII